MRNAQPDPTSASESFVRDRRIELHAARSAFLGTHMKFDIVCAQTEDREGEEAQDERKKPGRAAAIDRYHGCHVRLHLSIPGTFLRGK